MAKKPFPYRAGIPRPLNEEKMQQCRRVLVTPVDKDDEVEYAWLVEDINSPFEEPRFLGFEEKDKEPSGQKHFKWKWTDDPREAARFSRKIDARAVASFVHMDVHRLYEYAFPKLDEKSC